MRKKHNRPVKYDLTGNRFGKLLVLKRVENKGDVVMWLCRCDCGNEKPIRGGHLREGQIQCIECSSKLGNPTHGLSKHPSYTTWVMMKQRCENPNATGYHNYGAIGVKVCERWHDLKLFVEDVGVPPTPEHTLDRYPNKKGDYEPNNWRWATEKEQKRNTRTNRILTLNGVSKSLIEWSEETGLRYWTIFGRLKRGWSEEKALTTISERSPLRIRKFPKHKKNKNHE